MQTDLQSSTLARQPLTLPFPRHLTEDQYRRARLAASRPACNLFNAQRSLMKSQVFEQIAWLGLVLSSLGVLVVSFLL